MKKKEIISLLIVLMMIILPTLVKATYYEDIGMNISLPQEYIDLTNLINENPEEVKNEYNLEVEDIKNYYNKNNIILDSINKDKTKSIVIITLKNKTTNSIKNLNTLNDTNLTQFMKEYKKSKEEMGQTVIKQNVYLKGKEVFINSILEQKSKDKTIKINEFYTIVNNSAINISQNILSGEINEEEMQDVINKIEFTIIEKNKDTKLYIYTYILILLVMIILIMYYVYKSKNISKKTPEEKYIFEAIKTMKKESNYDKFDGYLKLFAVTLGLSILNTVIGIVSFFAGDINFVSENIIYNIIIYLSIAQNIIQLILLSYIVYKIKKQEVKSIKHIKKSLIVILVSTLILTTIRSSLVYFFMNPNEGYYISELKVLIQSITYAIIWYSYYRNSMRVAVYYKLNTLEEIVQNPITKNQRVYINGVIEKNKLIEYFRQNKATSYENGIYINKIPKEVNNLYLSELNNKSIIKLKKAKYYLDEKALEQIDKINKKRGILLAIAIVVMYIIIVNFITM